MFICKVPSLKLNSEAWASATEQRATTYHRRTDSPSNIRSQVPSNFHSTTTAPLDSPCCDRTETTAASGWSPHWRCAQAHHHHMNYTEPSTMNSLPFPRSSAGKRLYLIHPLSFVWPCLTMTTSRFFQPDGEVLQPSKGLAVVAGCSGNSVGQPDFRLCLITGGEGDSSIRNKIPYTIHTPSLSQRAGRMAKQKENRGKRLLPASELQHYTCYYFQHCYSYFLQRFVIMTSRLHVKAWFTVHFSLAKSAKQSRTASAALQCFYLC